MGFEPIEVDLTQFRHRPPPDLDELARVRVQDLPGGSGEGEPEADVDMAHRGRPHRLGHREEEGPVPEFRVGLGGNAEFFHRLAPDSVEGVLAGQLTKSDQASLRKLLEKCRAAFADGKASFAEAVTPARARPAREAPAKKAAATRPAKKAATKKTAARATKKA